jgi:hypothetical protein
LGEAVLVKSKSALAGLVMTSVMVSVCCRLPLVALMVKR